jgi:molybdopterin-guanine dinucleotide biosynthesis protein A
MEQVTGVVVAGGRSRRLGQDKRRLRLWGEGGPTLLEHTLQVLAPLCAELIVVLNDAEAWPSLPARLVPDVYEDAGSLGGIYAGLQTARHGYALVVGADMPLLSARLLDAMLARPRGYDALVPRALDPDIPRNRLSVEPLHAIYSRACLAPLKAMLDAGERRVVSFFDRVRVEVIEPPELLALDPEGRSFMNINTPEDVVAARKLIDR